MKTFTKTLFICSIATVMVGCKIAVLTSSGGDVQSSSGTMNCAGSSFCEFEVSGAPFAESFTAHPKAGYEFEKWSDGESFFCGKSTDPTCTVNIPEGAAGAVIVALFQSGYVMPIFKHVGIDTDGDGVRNELDEDDDNDGIFDVDDACPLDANLNCSINNTTQPSVEEGYYTTIYYSVYGDNKNAIRESMYGSGNPISCNSCSGHTVGLTKWHGEYQYWSDYKDPNKSICEIYDIDYSQTVTVTLPHLVGLAEKSFDIQSSWDSFATALLQHEVGHVLIAEELLETVPDALNSIGRVSCKDLGAIAKGRFDKAFQLVQDKSDDYDNETSHGKFQGVTF